MKRFLLVFILSFFMGAMGCGGGYPNDPEVRQENLGRQIRCPVCRGVSIAESSSVLASEMMQIIKSQMDEGKGDEEILKYFEERYGPWILLKPKAEGMNLTVWFLPALFFGGGVVFIILRVLKEKKRGGTP